MKSYLRYRYEGTLGAVATTSCEIFCKDGLVFTACNEALSCWSISENRCVKMLRVPFDSSEDIAYFDKITALKGVEGVPDLRWIAAGYEDGHIRVWNYETGLIDMSFYGHRKSIRALTTDLSGSLLASVDLSKEIIVWNLDEKEGKFRLSNADASSIAFLYPLVEVSGRWKTFRTEPSHLIAGGIDGFLRVWDLSTQDCIAVVATHSLGSIHSLLVLPDQSQVIVGLGGNTVEVFDLEDNFNPVYIGALKRPTTGGKKINGIFCIATNPPPSVRLHNGNVLADGRVISNEADVWEVYDTTYALLCSTFSNQVEVIFAFDKKTQSQRETRVLQRRLEKYKKRLSASDVKNQVDEELTKALGSSWQNLAMDESEDVRDTSKLKAMIDLLHNHLSETRGNPAKKSRILTETEEKEVEEDLVGIQAASLCAIKFRMLDERFEILGRAVNSYAAIRPRSGEALLLFNDVENQIERYIIDLTALNDAARSTETEALTTKIALARSLIGWADSLDNHPNKVVVNHAESEFACITAGGISIWNLKTRKCHIKLDKATKLWASSIRPTAAFFCSGDRFIVVGDSNGGISLVDIQAAKSVYTKRDGHTFAVTDLVLAPSKTRFYSICARSSSVSAWAFSRQRQDNEETQETLTFKEIQVSDLPDKPTCIAVSSNGQFIAVGLSNHTILLMFADTFKIQNVLYGHSLPVTSLAFSEDSTRLASGSVDRHIKIWDAKFGNMLKSLPVGRDGHPTCIGYVADEHVIITGLSDGEVQIWDSNSGQKVTKMRAGRADIKCLAMTSEAALFGSGDHTIKIWEKTEEQMFIEDENDREITREETLDAARSDKSLPLSGVRDIVMASRPTLKDVETVRSIEQLMRVLEDCADEGPSATYKILNLTPHDYLIRSISTIPTERIMEVIIALPYPLAIRILKVCEEELKKGSKLIKKNPSMSILITSRLETLAKVVLAIVHAYRKIISAEKQVDVAKLSKYIRSVVSSELDVLRQNSAIFSLIA